MKKVVVTGGTGFIGSRLVKALQQKQYEVILIGRHAPEDTSLGFIQCDLEKDIPTSPHFDHVYSVIHLAGRPVFGRWNDEVKRQIYDSRVKGTKNLFAAFKSAKGKPKVFVGASAVGYYGDRGDKELDEKASSGKDFLAKVCRDWEKASQRFEELQTRRVLVRTALVFGNGGLLTLLLPIFRKGLGGPIGNGKQWMSWIHVDDLVNVYIEVLENDSYEGPVNGCAPEQITNREFTKMLGALLHRPAFFRVYRWMLRLAFGGFADAIVASQRVVPSKLKKFGFQYQYTSARKALAECVRQFSH